MEAGAEEDVGVETTVGAREEEEGAAGVTGADTGEVATVATDVTTTGATMTEEEVAGIVAVTEGTKWSPPLFTAFHPKRRQKSTVATSSCYPTI